MKFNTITVARKLATILQSTMVKGGMADVGERKIADKWQSYCLITKIPNFPEKVRVFSSMKELCEFLRGEIPEVPNDLQDKSFYYQ